MPARELACLLVATVAGIVGFGVLAGTVALVSKTLLVLILFPDSFLASFLAGRKA